MKKALSFLLLLAVFCGTGWSLEKLMLPPSVTGPMTLDFVQGYRFDPLTIQPTLPAILTITGYPKGAKGYYLVQFAGPIDYIWKEHVNDLGGFVLGYQPNYAFVVRMDEAVRAKVEQLPEVRWVGLLQPAYKLFPYNLLGTGPRTVIVVLHPGESDGAFEAKAKELGGKNFTWDINEVNKSVRFDVDASRIPKFASLTEVDWIEPWSDWTLDNTDAQWVTQMGWRSVAPPPTERLVWQKGVQGDWMDGPTHRYAVIGHVDDGLDPRHCAFIDPAVPISGSGNYPTHRKIIAYLGSFSPSATHGTHTAGSACGNDWGATTNDGMALMAKMFHKTWPSGSWDMNTWWGDMYQGNAGGKAYSMTMSLDRKDSFNLYVFTDMTADQFHWRYKDFIETNSLGNSGGNTMGHPAIAKDNIVVGNVMNGIQSNQLYSSSGRGPCADGRMKPNLVAPGTYVYSAQAGSGCAYVAMSATSMAAGVAAGCVALVRCYFEKGFYPTGDSVPANRFHPSGALVKAVLTVGADSNIVNYTVPDNNIGWGRIDLDSSLYFAGDVKRLWIYDDTAVGLRTGDSAIHTISVTNSSHSFRVVMCYSDTAGPMRASRTLVNDLDLTVISPGGTEYLGNVWSGGQSQTGGLRDSIQETECFRLNNPAQGVWTIKVKANNVPAGGTKGQPYALAVTGAVSGSGVEEPASKEPVPLREFSLGPASPNPMHRRSEISFFLPQASPVSLSVFSVTGQLVKVLADGPHDAGAHRVPWDGRDGKGFEVASGVYFYRLEASDYSAVRKVVILR
jgi:hypothetical protein